MVSPVNGAHLSRLIRTSDTDLTVWFDGSLSEDQTQLLVVGFSTSEQDYCFYLEQKAFLKDDKQKRKNWRKKLLIN